MKTIVNGELYKKERIAYIFMAELKKPKILKRKTCIDLLTIFSQIKHIKLIFNSIENGFRRINFDRICDKIYGTSTIAESKGGMITGGLSVNEWSGTHSKLSVDAFLFSIKNKRIYKVESFNPIIYC